jgi:hypothetical protein
MGNAILESNQQTIRFKTGKDGLHRTLYIIGLHTENGQGHQPDLGGISRNPHRNHAQPLLIMEFNPLGLNISGPVWMAIEHDHLMPGSGQESAKERAEGTRPHNANLHANSLQTIIPALLQKTTILPR